MSLRLVAILILVLSVIGAVLAISEGLPAEFGGRGDPDNVAGEFLTRGTAMSPPLVPMIVLAALLAISLSRAWWGTLALIGMGIVGVLFAVGGLGEPNNPAGSDLPQWVHLTIKVLGVGLSVLLVVLVLAEIVLRLKLGRPRDAG